MGTGCVYQLIVGKKRKEKKGTLVLFLNTQYQVVLRSRFVFNTMAVKVRGAVGNPEQNE